MIMRVISGKFKYKTLLSPQGNNVRPTTDRIKETIFNILSSKGKVGAISVLDLFGGSGALGIESLSRGAVKAVFVDKNGDSIKLIRKNLENVGAISDTYEVYKVDYAFALKKLAGQHFDLIFADPPYAAGYEKDIMDSILKYDILSRDGVLMIEHDAFNRFDVPEKFVFDRRLCGVTGVTFLSYREDYCEK